VRQHAAEERWCLIDLRLAAPGAAVADISGTTPEMEGEGGPSDRPQPQGAHLHRAVEMRDPPSRRALAETRTIKSLSWRQADEQSRPTVRMG